jgi:phosphate transport system substrate-binding protein
VQAFRNGRIIAALAAISLLSACASSGGSTTGDTGATNPASTAATSIACSSGTLNAEGSTAQTNAINQWIQDFSKACPNATINYSPSGSGAGVTGFNNGTDDFAGSDSALNAAKGEYAAAQNRCGSDPLDLPAVVGPIAVAYKVAGVDKLILDGPTTAKIFLGKTTSWNDPAIGALNPGVTLPSTKISVVYRSDSSGTTENFEKYLAATAPDVWTSTPDKDSSKAGFAGTGAAKSQGVAAAIGATDGAIGYVEYSFAVSGGLSTAWIDNGSGPVELSKDSAASAAGAAKVAAQGPGDLTLTLDFATKTAGAYPIILVTYEIACTKYAANGQLVKDFLSYAVGAGQDSLAQLGYAPLPASLQSQVAASVATIS